MGIGIGKWNCKVIINPAAQQLLKHIVLHSAPRACSCALFVSLDQPDTSVSWPISEALSLTNVVSKPIIYVFIREWHSRARACPHTHACTHSIASIWGKENTLLDT